MAEDPGGGKSSGSGAMRQSWKGGGSGGELGFEEVPFSPSPTGPPSAGLPLTVCLLSASQELMGDQTLGEHSAHMCQPQTLAEHNSHLFILGKKGPKGYVCFP